MLMMTQVPVVRHALPQKTLAQKTLTQAQTLALTLTLGLSQQRAALRVQGGDAVRVRGPLRLPVPPAAAAAAVGAPPEGGGGG